MYFLSALMVVLLAGSHYLEGRIAESQNDWGRAREEFKQVGADDPLHSLATWHNLRASIHLHDEANAEQLLRLLPRDFPPAISITGPSTPPQRRSCSTRATHNGLFPSTPFHIHTPFLNKSIILTGLSIWLQFSGPKLCSV